MKLLAPLCAAALTLAAGARGAAAQHDHHAEHGHGGDGSTGAEAPAVRSRFGAAIGVFAAGYDSMLYTGDYQGLALTGRWSRGRYAAAASVAGYRIDKNGRTVSGLGDAMVHAHASLLSRGPTAVGAVAMVMVPTGDHDAGLGMGHVMLMPGAWIHWAPWRLSLAASAGYARGLGGDNVHAEHGGGAWPLVDPMTTSELTFGGTGTVRLADALRAGVRLDGAVPLDAGDTRLTGGVRATWTRGRIETTAELAAGLAGKPFGLRGLLEAAVRFD